MRDREGKRHKQNGRGYFRGVRVTMVHPQALVEPMGLPLRPNPQKNEKRMERNFQTVTTSGFKRETQTLRSNYDSTLRKYDRIHAARGRFSFLTTTKPHSAASKQTISRWVKARRSKVK
jgi:hypothetical protein